MPTSVIPLTLTPVGAVANITGGSSIGLSDQIGVTSIPSFTAVGGFATITITPTFGGCTGLPQTVGITVSDVLIAETHINNTVNGGSTGSIDLSVSGGVSPYTYLWNTGQTTQDRTGLSQGSYTVVVTDAIGQTATLTIGITEPALPSFTFSITGIDENNTNGGVSRAWFDFNATSGTVDWGDGNSSSLVSGVNQHNYASTGVRHITVYNIVESTTSYLTFQGSYNVSSFDVSLLTNLQALTVTQNKLSGSIPSFSTNTALTHLILSSNQLTGSIPSFSTNTALMLLWLESNQLTGTIPSFSSNTFLESLYLSHNQLTEFSGGFGLTFVSTNGYDFSTNFLTQGAVDAILSAYKTISTLDIGDFVHVAGTGNATPSVTGLIDKGIIQATGALCLTN